MVKKILSENVGRLRPEQFYKQYLVRKKPATARRYVRYYNSLRRKRRRRPLARKYRRRLGLDYIVESLIEYECKKFSKGVTRKFIHIVWVEHPRGRRFMPITYFERMHNKSYGDHILIKTTWVRMQVGYVKRWVE